MSAQSGNITRQKWLMLRAFLIGQSLAGNPTALKLLKDMPRNTGKVSA